MRDIIDQIQDVIAGFGCVIAAIFYVIVVILLAAAPTMLIIWFVKYMFF